MDEDEKESRHEWTLHKIMAPADEPDDEDDALDERMDAMERKRRERVYRGGGLFPTQ